MNSINRINRMIYTLNESNNWKDDFENIFDKNGNVTINNVKVTSKKKGNKYHLTFKNDSKVVELVTDYLDENDFEIEDLTEDENEITIVVSK